MSLLIKTRRNTLHDVTLLHRRLSRLLPPPPAPTSVPSPTAAPAAPGGAAARRARRPGGAGHGAALDMRFERGSKSRASRAKLQSAIASTLQTDCFVYFRGFAAEQEIAPREPS